MYVEPQSRIEALHEGDDPRVCLLDAAEAEELLGLVDSIGVGQT